MNTCARCGSADCDVETRDDCDDQKASDRVACRDRELANLRSLLRSVTRQLENALECILDDRPSSASDDIRAVLEALS